MSENRSTRSRPRGRRGGRNGQSRNRGRRRNNNRPTKKQNPILAFFSKFFGGSSQPSKPKGRRSNEGQKSRNGTPKVKEEKMPEVTSTRLYVGNLPYESS
ncbi:MAG: hypothetical protein AAFY98_09570, partial [Verrucomicrobiota bacterium]